MDPDLKLRFERISPKVLNSFFIEKRSKLLCHQCGCENFTIPTLDNSLKSSSDAQVVAEDETGPVIVVPHVIFSDGPDIPHKVYFYPVTCINCGIMQSVNAQVVLDWYERRSRGEK